LRKEREEQRENKTGAPEKDAVPVAPPVPPTRTPQSH